LKYYYWQLGESGAKRDCLGDKPLAMTDGCDIMFIMNSKMRNVVLVVVVVLGAGFTYFSATSFVPKMLVTLTKAAPATKVSFGSSYMLGSKILCKADGLDRCNVNVFLSDAESHPVPGKEVSLLAEGAKVSTLEGKSDQLGKVSFDLTSEVEGQVKVVALVDGVPMEKTVVVTFRGN